MVLLKSLFLNSSLQVPVIIVLPVLEKNTIVCTVRLSGNLLLNFSTDVHRGRDIGNWPRDSVKGCPLVLDFLGTSTWPKCTTHAHFSSAHYGGTMVDNELSGMSLFLIILHKPCALNFEKLVTLRRRDIFHKFFSIQTSVLKNHFFSCLLFFNFIKR